ncbi:hypothetical protein CVV38_02875 [Candidatus Peregrinibacteria bacterium HGW-Peregrinibacteria-1]|jgi:peptidoglycan hydrolase-like protein with peptidoglycan-binding domain/3D (Asp-Asp-Asp) domain-containing protein|nr:MAG: hypothetical protein CVV38_02875 [Candidatus Peregrinibacteria bacterium HGW-Peregrinibacteria-1]
MKTKKYLALGLLAMTLVGAHGAIKAHAESFNKTFIISAYYSPLPCQDRYATGSYEGDKRLNGNGTNGADGTPVYAGMVAAPKTYAFGTKMHIPGLGVVAVHDRGGAIVSADSGRVAYDRLDIWMGYGDPGLKRALTWGKRTLDITVYGVDPSIREDFQIQGFSPEEAIPKSCGGSTPVAANPVVPKSPTVVTPPAQPAPTNAASGSANNVDPLIEDLFNRDLRTGDVNNDVRRLQNELRRLHYFKIDSTAVYGDLTTHAVFKFQQSQGLVGSKEDLGAGVFGPKTRTRLNEIIKSRMRVSQLITEGSQADDSTGGPVVNKKYAFAPFVRELDPGTFGDDIKNLQELLREEGFFDNAYTTDFYGEKTREAVIKFQLANGIINLASDLGAGRVGPATLVKLNALIGLE